MNTRSRKSIKTNNVADVSKNNKRESVKRKIDDDLKQVTNNKKKIKKKDLNNGKTDLNYY